ncbi:uncharacterized protein [Amphiura filiformis]|uniref:uncharacterized protein n=1 Tax=Amphiura filiformis TaxID=82378 RepID=UPI003B2286F5
MDTAACSTSAECSFDILTDDVLIIIFSFLTLYERLMVMRVNKRCKRIFSSSHAWTYIDFWEEQKTNKNWAVDGFNRTRMFWLDDKSWMFPVDEKAVLDFLKRYTSGALKSIYLHTASTNILAYLQQTYGNLETISFISANDPPREARALDMKHSYKPLPHDHDDNLPVAKSVRVCEIPMYTVGCNGCGEMHDKLVIRLGKCKNLRRLTITGMNPRFLKPDGWDALSQDITELNFLSTAIPRRGCRGQSSGLDFSSQLCTMLAALLKLTKVRCFRLSIDNPDNADRYFKIDEFLCGIADKWQDLRRLTLIGIRPPSGEIFPMMIAALTQLQVLELYGQMITDENIAHIAKHLKKLTSLKLADGPYTSTGIKGLCGHPSIERLYLLQGKQYQPVPEWVSAVYNVILSLPKIVYVKLLGYRIIALHAREEMPTISPTVQIDVENTRLRMPVTD